MDKQVSVRFFEVSRVSTACPTLRDVLEGIYAHPSVDRECNVGQFYRVRLERLDMDGPNVVGELTRIQLTDFPSEVHDDRTVPLPGDLPLGHGVAFAYSPQAGVLALQWDVRVVSLSKFAEYLALMGADARFHYEPIVREDAWERFEADGLDKIVLKVASPSNVAAVENDGEAAAESFRRMGDAYQAAYIKIEISMGRQRGTLADGAKDMIRRLVNLGQSGEVDVRTAQVRTSNENAAAVDRNIDFIKATLVEKDELALPDRDPDRSYLIRSNFVKTKMQRHGFWTQ